MDTAFAPMSREEAERLWRRFHECGWTAYLNDLSIHGRPILLLWHPRHRSHKVASAREATKLLALG